jgi:hypothetical protein
MALTLGSMLTSSEDTFQSFRFAIGSVICDAAYPTGGYAGLKGLMNMSQIISATCIGRAPYASALPVISYDPTTDRMAIYGTGAALSSFLAEITPQTLAGVGLLILAIGR